MSLVYLRSVAYDIVRIITFVHIVLQKGLQHLNLSFSKNYLISRFRAADVEQLASIVYDKSVLNGNLKGSMKPLKERKEKKTDQGLLRKYSSL